MRISKWGSYRVPLGPEWGTLGRGGLLFLLPNPHRKKERNWGHLQNLLHAQGVTVLSDSYQSFQVMGAQKAQVNGPCRGTASNLEGFRDTQTICL